MSKQSHLDALPYRKGVGLALFNHQGLVFAARRLDTANAWQMPQGGIDPGETPETAVFREMKEEIGTNRAEIIGESRHWLTYDLPPELVGKVWKGRYRGQQQKWFALRFTGDDSEITVATDHPEFSDWRWIRLPLLLDLIVPFKRDLYQAVVAEFAPIAQRLAAQAAD